MDTVCTRLFRCGNEEWKTGPLFTVHAEVRPDTDTWRVVLDMDTDDGEW